MCQLTEEPTRMTDTLETVIDLISTSDSEITSHYGVRPCRISKQNIIKYVHIF